ncbi:hypothetical protein [Jiangella endophytica]|nr:hypothetical protein [Jiangella endophytica]
MTSPDPRERVPDGAQDDAPGPDPATTSPTPEAPGRPDGYEPL